jgi:ribokinase
MNRIMEKNQITVIGSSNTDMVVKTARLPVPGETVLGGSFFMNAGGKGANQAVAAARLGGRVNFVARTGNDIFGSQSRQLFLDEQINISHVVIDTAYPSGVALIAVDDHAENLIVVAPGANGNLRREDIDQAAQTIRNSGIILLQLEIPLDTVNYATNLAWGAGTKVVLNPAPARELPDELIRKLYLITPNETEAEILTGVHVEDEVSAEKAAGVLKSKGVQHVIITLGSKGAYYSSAQVREMIPAPKVTPVDTTAAGDVFNGAVCVALAEGLSMPQAIAFANKAAAISVTRRGAQASAPYRHEI